MSSQAIQQPTAAVRARPVASGPAGTVPPLRLVRDPMRRMLLLLIVFNISRVHQHFSFLTPLRPALLLVAGAAVYAYLNPRYLVTGSILRTQPARIMAALGVMACLSVPFAISMGASGMFIISEYSKVLVFAFLLVAAIRDVRDLYTFVWAFAVSNGVLAYLALFVFKMQVASDSGIARISGGYSYDANDIGCVIVTGIALVMLMVQVTRGRQRLVFGLMLLGIGATIAKTGSRGAFVGLVAVGGALLVLLSHVSLDKRIGFVLAVAVGLALAAPEGYWRQMNTITNPKADYNWTAPSGRKAVAKRGLQYMMSNPISGIGIGNFPRAEGMISDRAKNHQVGMAGIKWSAAHNSFLQVAAEMGLPGIGLFCALVFGNIVGLIRLRRRLPRAWLKGDPEQRFLYLLAIYLPVSMIGFAVAGFFVSFAYLDLVYVLSAFVAGMYVATAQKLKAARPDAAVAAPVRPAVRYRGGLPPAVLPRATRR